MQTAAPATPHADARCGARTKRGTGTCKHPAGFRTDHVGQGKCWLHGGATPEKHGRYSLIQRPRVADLCAKFGVDPNPLDTHPEIALVRALLVDYIERYDAYTDALIAWHESYRAGVVPLSPVKVEALRATLDEYEELVQGGDGLTDTQTEALQLARECVDRLAVGSEVGGKPHQVLDVADAYRMAGEVTKMVERVQKADAADAVSLKELERLVFGMSQVVAAHVPDEAARAKIGAEWRALRV